MTEPTRTTTLRPTGEPGWEEVDLQFESLRQLEADFVQYLASDGLFVPTIDPLPPSSVVRLRLLLPGDFVLLEGTGVVFWVRQPDESGPVELPPGMAIRFAALGPQHQDMVDRLIRSLVERGGQPFNLDQAVAAAEGPAPQATRGRSPEVARLQVRGSNRPPSVTATASNAAVAADSEADWAERTVSLGVPPIHDLAAAKPSEERRAPAPEASASSGGPSVDETLELAWARAEAAGVTEGTLPVDGGDQPPASDRPRVEPALVEPERVSPGVEPPVPDPVEPRVEVSPLVVAVAPAPRVEPAPVSAEHPEAPGEDPEPVEVEEALPRTRSRRLVAGLAGLCAVAAVVAGLLVLDPLGWRSRGTVAAPADATGPASMLEPPVAPEAGATAHETSADQTSDAPESQPESAPVEPESVVDDGQPVAPPAPLAVDEPVAAAPARRVVDIAWVSADGVTTVVVQGDGAFEERRVAVDRLSSPPRVLVRLHAIEERYPRYTLEVGTEQVLRVRTGHHPELTPPALFVVLDLADESIEVQGTEVSGVTARVTVGRPTP